MTEQTTYQIKIQGWVGRHWADWFDGLEMTYEGAEHVPMASLVHDTLCGSFSGLSKVYRACGYRVGWAVFSGNRENAGDYLHALELLSALRYARSLTGACQEALSKHAHGGCHVKPGSSDPATDS